MILQLENSWSNSSPESSDIFLRWDSLARAPPKAGTLFSFFASNVLAVVMFTVADMVTATPLLLLLLAFPMSFIGDQLGHRAFHRFGGSTYRPVALVVALVLGGWNTYAGLQ